MTQALNLANLANYINSSGKLDASQALTGTVTSTGLNISNDASISGLTVGKGGGSVATGTTFGYQALNSNTTGVNNTAVGYQAGYSATGGLITAVGYKSGFSTTSGNPNLFLGYQAGYSNTTGSSNSIVGSSNTFYYNTTGSNNTAFGDSALYNNTTASNNTAVGYQAGYNNQTGGVNTFLGRLAGYVSSNSSGNVFLGASAGYTANSNSGANDNNTFVGYASGYYVTTGTKNTILGGYNGNQSGLDIRTASNYIVLSDGDGNPRGIFDGSGDFLVNTTGINASNLSGFVVRAYAGGIYTENGHNTSASSGDSYTIFRYNGSQIGSITQTGTTAVLYNTTSDYRLKNDVTPIQNALSTINELNPISFTWVDGRKDDGFLAHELQAVIPNCVTGEKDAVNEDGSPKYQQMDNSGVIPFLVKAIQELKAEFDAYKATHP